MSELFQISNIEMRFGVPVFGGTLVAATLTVGDKVEILRGDEEIASGLVCGVVVNGKALDYAKAGNVVQCTVRGDGVMKAKAGDWVLVRT